MYSIGVLNFFIQIYCMKCNLRHSGAKYFPPGSLYISFCEIPPSNTSASIYAIIPNGSTNITAILQRVTFPILSKIQDDTQRLISVYRDYIKISSLGIFLRGIACSKAFILLASIATLVASIRPKELAL